MRTWDSHILFGDSPAEFDCAAAINQLADTLNGLNLPLAPYLLDSAGRYSDDVVVRLAKDLATSGDGALGLTQKETEFFENYFYCVIRAETTDFDRRIVSLSENPRPALFENLVGMARVTREERINRYGKPGEYRSGNQVRAGGVAEIPLFCTVAEDSVWALYEILTERDIGGSSTRPQDLFFVDNGLPTDHDPEVWQKTQDEELEWERQVWEDWLARPQEDDEFSAMLQESSQEFWEHLEWQRETLPARMPSSSEFVLRCERLAELLPQCYGPSAQPVTILQERVQSMVLTYLRESGLAPSSNPDQLASITHEIQSLIQRVLSAPKEES